MKKILLIVGLILWFSIIAFTDDLYPSKYEGTYIPVVFKDILEASESYYQSINKTKGIKFYDVLCLRKNKIYSNLKFHDAFQLNDTKVDFTYLEDNNIYYIIDNQTFVQYIKISDSTDYYSAYQQYLCKTILSKNIPDGFTEIAINDIGFIYLNKVWKIDLDQYHYGDDVLLILYNDGGNGEYLALVKENHTTDLYRMKYGEDLFQILDRKINTYRFSSYSEFTSYLVSNYEKGDLFYDEVQYITAILSYQEVVDAFEFINYSSNKFDIFDNAKNESVNLQLYYYSIYNIACCYSLLGDYYQARVYLLNAIQAGYPHLDYMINDQDLTKLYETNTNLKETITKRFKDKNK